MVGLWRVALLFFLILISSSAFALDVILVDEQFPGSSSVFYSELKQTLSKNSFPCSEVNASNLTNALKSAAMNNVLIIPNAEYFPLEAKQALLDYLKRGNHLIAISGPAFANMLLYNDGEWITREQAKDAVAGFEGKTIIDFATADISAWTRSTNDPNSHSERKKEPRAHGRPETALHVSIPKLPGWDILSSPPMDDPFPENYDATVFRAMGIPHTRQLMIEWKEKDGSRWMTTVDLIDRWQEFVLLPQDLKFWGGNKNRGKEGDKFNPANASSISFGLSNGITDTALGASHHYWISDIRAVKNNFAKMDFEPPVLETLSPKYKSYKTNCKALVSRTGQEVYIPRFDVNCAIPRARGVGADRMRPWRYIPLLNAIDSDGIYRGSVAHLYLNLRGSYTGSVWGFLGLDQKDLERSSQQSSNVIVDMLKHIDRGVFLTNGGTECFSYSVNEKPRCGAFIVNLSDKSQEVIVNATVTSQGKELFSDGLVVSIPGKTVDKAIQVQTSEFALPAGLHAASVECVIEGQVADTISHSFSVVDYSPIQPKDTVTIRDGEFYLSGKKWRPVGVNYWPRYSTGQEKNVDPLRWFSSEQYDPDIVELDLELAEKLGIDLLSIQYIDSKHARNLIDFLHRARSHGMKINIYVPGLHPLEQNFGLADRYIKSARLAENPAVFAFDLGWEVHVGTYSKRSDYDHEWQRWVIDRYGSIAFAEDAWGYKPERVDGIITGPSDDQLKNDGEWRVYVAAYRRFWDDEISSRYHNVREFCKSVAPHILISARSGLGGNGIPEFAHMFPFDLASGAKHLDFISPEGYSPLVDRDTLLKNAFTVAYARLVSNGKPVYWAEFGRSIVPKNGDGASIEMQSDFYNHMNEMFKLSASNAVAAWWWPGGYRVDELSDYGIINPDGTPRPSALLIEKYAEHAANPPGKHPDSHINIDRDEWVNGYAGLYTQHAADYVNALKAGKLPALRTEGTGTTSANCPLVAVGNVEDGPAKYLNAEFNYIRINGKVVSDGETVQVDKGQPITIEASVGNTGEAKWLAPKSADLTRKGDVVLNVLLRNPESQAEFSVTQPIRDDAEFLTDTVVKPFQIIEKLKETTEVEFRLHSLNRTPFGEIIRIRIETK